MATGYDYSWFVTNQTIVRKEFSLSGSEQNPDLTGKDWRLIARRAVGKNATGPVEAFKTHGVDFIVKPALPDLVAAMNALAGGDLVKLDALRREIEARDREVANPFTKDAQIMGVHNARRFLGDKIIRTAPPHRILDPAHGPLIAVRLNILTRKTLGGLETDLDAPRVRRGWRDHSRPLRGGRGGGIRRRRHARLSLAGGHVSRRLPVLRPGGGPRGGEGGGVNSAKARRLAFDLRRP